MADTELVTTTERHSASWRGRLRAVGPGLILAAGGVGAGDLITALTGSARFGMTLLWASALGAVLKFAATEALGRLYMATGDTILRSVRKVGKWLSVAFLVFFALMGLLYAAALSSLLALATEAMVPGLSQNAWAVIVTLVAFTIVFIGRYRTFERVMTAFAVVMFVCIVGTAVFTLTNLSDPGQFFSTLTPGLPKGSSFNVIAILGGVGGTFSIATYGYWVRDKGWRGGKWIPTMRLDAGVGYVVTFLFAFSLFIVGSQFLFTRGATISGAEGLLALANPVGATLGYAIRWLFLIGFFFVVFSSLVGGMNGLSYLLSDSVRVLRNVPDEDAEGYIAENSIWFRGFLAYCTFPAIAITLLGKPVFLALLYAAFGALILPLLAVVLLWHLNRKQVSRRYRNKILANTFLGVALVLFVGLAVKEIIGIF